MVLVCLSMHLFKPFQGYEFSPLGHHRNCFRFDTKYCINV